MKPRIASLALLAASTLGSHASAQSILVLNGVGAGTVDAPLAAAGFNVINGTLDPDQIASVLSVPNDIIQIWIWNDGTFGNTGSPADPTRDFNAFDLAALDLFSAIHPHFVMDGLAWRGHLNVDEQNLTANIALELAAAGGGIVLGADDASGDAIVQHVNQVGTHFGFAPFQGVYRIDPSLQHDGGSLFTTPNPVNVTGISSTFSYCDVPSGLQANGRLLSTALFAEQVADETGYTNPILPDEAFGGVLYTSVGHLVTTTLPGGGINTNVTYCFGDGSGSNCPCGNNGVGGAGCDNSFGTGGGQLVASGLALVSGDSLQLNGSGMPPTTSVLYFQGTVALNGTLGVTFGDGLRCVGGTVVRLGTKTTVGGAADFGAPVCDVPISVRGAIPAGGGTFFYQAWYRNSASFCTAAGFNLTNAVAITWAP
ncbi:MAG: hypothetical protein NTY35_07365 [Planctomycetota bacterium]|nr:hypothetical protein [Planctomycetota bacterium]